MTISVTPHLNFRGNALQALGFYQSVFGGDMFVMTYEQVGAGGTAYDPTDVMYGHVATSDGFKVMAYDTQLGRALDRGQNAFYVSVESENREQISDFWGRLSEGAVIMQELAPAPWAPLYGMLRDRFGVVWFLSVPH